MENSTSPIVEPINEIEEQIVSLSPPPPQPRTDPVLDPTDLSDTTESEAEKHTGNGYIYIYMDCTFNPIFFLFIGYNEKKCFSKTEHSWRYEMYFSARRS